MLFTSIHVHVHVDMHKPNTLKVVSQYDTMLPLQLVVLEKQAHRCKCTQLF